MRDKLLFAFIMVALAGGSPSFRWSRAKPRPRRWQGDSVDATPGLPNSSTLPLAVANIEQDF